MSEPIPDNGAVDVWTVPLELPPPTVSRLRGTLSEEEVERLRRSRSDAERRRFIVAHGALRRILGGYLGEPPEDLRWTRGPHGKPRLAGTDSHLRFNLSHAGELGLVAVTTRGEVGVDVDLPRSGMPVRSFAARYFPEAEADMVAGAGPSQARAAFLRLWTRKEAVVKAAGGRVVQGLRLPVATSGSGAASGAIVVRDPTGTIAGTWSVQDLPMPGEYAAAVAVEGRRAPMVTVRASFRAPLPET
ncbi:4'-phosphopantetheinyl transferase family protein [Spirillospora sp. NBC_01491]|uniref:4'-phosphopantetheinyl transferase family protein n=1 Tax=Spirillospora sp. NBC_01491 TaxID=2976007 RepID=UPI002E3303E5|nr:4'-phosphopantetheinyl transferase superfamily protein [Spirillospora sp. NBC_01491]